MLFLCSRETPVFLPAIMGSWVLPGTWIIFANCSQVVNSVKREIYQHSNNLNLQFRFASGTRFQFIPLRPNRSPLINRTGFIYVFSEGWILYITMHNQHTLAVSSVCKHCVGGNVNEFRIIKCERVANTLNFCWDTCNSWCCVPTSNCIEVVEMIFFVICLFTCAHKINSF